MLRLAAIMVLACGIGACAPDRQQRVHDFNDDGIFLYQQGDYNHARLCFEAALGQCPDDPNLLYNIGECRVRAGQLAAAERSFQDCLTHAPNHVECRHAFASLLYDEGRREEAVRMVTEWTQHNPKLSSPYVEDAYLWHRYGDLPRAVEQLQTALALNPHDPYALAELGRVYDDMNLTNRAVDMYERSLLIHPQEPDIKARLTALRAKSAAPPAPSPDAP
jgi:Tfp pilus assembly protein PilF